MASINKLLDKVNQATSAVKSLKGIKSKLEGKSYKGTYDKDMLASEKAKAEKLLDDRRSSLQANLDASNQARQSARKVPLTKTRDLQYPLEALDSYIIFTTRPRKKREGTKSNEGNNKNLLSGSENVAIALYAPESIDQDTDVSWSTMEIGANKRNLINTFKGETGFGQAFEELVQSGLTSLANTATAGISNFIGGKAKNPMEEQVFEGVSFRDHSFDYEFYPKSKDEAKMVEDICWTFKTAMLPDTYGAAESDGAAESYFNYPNIFDITYEGLINKHFEDYLPCVLTSVSVNHSTKMFEDGYPVATELSLSFTEIKLLTQENYQSISKASPDKFSEEQRDLGEGSASLLAQQNPRRGG
jgi:hypothetical protein